jgi:Domain of unknown function (DUF1905)/Bacteriocin-protection, YdeI or OmpD-Associated
MLRRRVVLVGAESEFSAPTGSGKCVGTSSRGARCRYLGVRHSVTVLKPRLAIAVSVRVDALSGADEHLRMASQRLRFTAKLQPQRRGWLGVQLPSASAAALATRSQARVRATIRGVTFETVAFPDGKGGHFVLVNAPLRRRLELAEGERIEVAIERAAPRPPSPVPAELLVELSRSRAAQVAWDGLTEAARQIALRWIGSAKLDETRSYRARDVLRRALRHDSGTGPFYPTDEDQKFLSQPQRRRRR